MDKFRAKKMRSPRPNSRQANPRKYQTEDISENISPPVLHKFGNRGQKNHQPYTISVDYSSVSHDVRSNKAKGNLKSDDSPSLKQAYLKQTKELKKMQRSTERINRQIKKQNRSSGNRKKNALEKSMDSKQSKELFSRLHNEKSQRDL